MNAGTCWGKNTIDPRGRGVERPRKSDFTLQLLLTIREEMTSTSIKYRDKITTHPNELASTLLEKEENRRLKIFKPTDLSTRFL
jgi:hypothetical protein